MTKQTTTLLTAGPRVISPWGDRAWRISLSAQLVEGGSVAYWLPTATQPPLTQVSPDFVEVATPSPDDLLDATLMLIALNLGDEKVEDWLVATHNAELADGVRVLAPYWEIADDQREYLCQLLSPHVRLGLTNLAEFSLANQEFVSALGSYGFDVDVFGLVNSSLVNS